MDSNSVHHTPAKRRLQDSGCSGDNKLPRRFFEKGREPSFEKSIVYHSNGDLMDLMENLGYTALERIRNSPLGIFYKFYKHGFIWASRIVQHTLAYQIECQKPYEIWCVFGRHPVRFSVAEFQRITGLNCDNIPHLIRPKAEETDQEKEKFYGFWEKLQTPADRGPNKKSLQLALRSCKDWEEEDKVRLGYLSIYVQYIQGMGPRDNSNLELTKMVMNLPQFEGYPWGRVAFYYLIKSVKEVNMCARQLTLKGFVQALQVWVYMALPEFGEKYGSKIVVSESTPPILSYKGSYKRKNFAKSMMKPTVKTCCFLNREGQDELPPWEDDVPDKKIDELVCRIRENHPFAESDWSGKGVYDDGFPRLPGDRRPAKKMRTASGISDRTPSPNEQHHRAALIPADLRSRPEFRLAYLFIILRGVKELSPERAAPELRQNCGDRETVNNRRLGEYHIADGCQDGESLEKLSDFSQKDKVLVGEEDIEFGIGGYNRPETKQELSLRLSSSHGDLEPATGPEIIVLDDEDDCSPVDEDRRGLDTLHQVHKTTAGNEELCVVPLEPGRTTVKAVDDPGTEKISQLKTVPTTDAATIADAEGSKEIFGQGGYRPMGGDLKSDVDKGPSKWDSRCVERTTVKAPDDPETDEFKKLNFSSNTEAETSADAEGFKGMDVVKQEVDCCLNSHVDKGAPNLDTGCVERTTVKNPDDPEADELKQKAATRAVAEGSEGMDVVKQEVDCCLNSHVDKGAPNLDTGCVERTTVKAPDDPKTDKFGPLKIEAATYADAEGSEGGLEQGGYRPNYEQGGTPMDYQQYFLGIDDFPCNSVHVESAMNLDTSGFEMPACADERVTGDGVDVIKSESTNDSECIGLRERDCTKQLEVEVPMESVSVTNTESVEVPSESIPDTRSVLSCVASNDPGNTHIANNSNLKLAATKDPSTNAHVEVSAVLFPEGVSRPVDVVEPDCMTLGVVGVTQEPVMLPKMENEELVSKSEPETISCRVGSVPNDEENAARRNLTDKKSKPPRQRQSKALKNPSDHKKKAAPNQMNTRKRAAQLKRDREMIGDETHEAVRRETQDAQLAERKAGKKKTAVNSSKQGAGSSSKQGAGSSSKQGAGSSSEQGAGKSNSAKTADENWKEYVLKTPTHIELKGLLNVLRISGNRGSPWMKTLRMKGKWLEDTHMDMAMDMFRTRYKNGPKNFKDVGMAFLGVDFTTAWTRQYENFLKAREAGFISLPAGTLDYFYGNVKKRGQLKQKWVDQVSDLYCPLHIPPDHWVAMHVDLFGRKITIWDSIISYKSENDIQQAVKPYQDMFPATIKELIKDDGYSLEPFVYKRVKDVPQNRVAGDCGVYTLKFIEWHAIGNNIGDLVGKLSDSNIKGMRDRLALDIYNLLGFYGQYIPKLHVPDLGLYDDDEQRPEVKEEEPTM